MSDFVDALLTGDRHADVAADLFEPFLGSWRLVVTWYDEHGTETRRCDGEWHFARVLEGRGIQDVWIVPSRGSRGSNDEYEFGTSIRFARPDGTWRSTWIGPQHGVVRTFLARQVGTTVSLETEPGAEPAMRWEFFNISEGNFEWRNVLLGDVDRITQHFRADRMPAEGAGSSMIA